MSVINFPAQFAKNQRCFIRKDTSGAPLKLPAAARKSLVTAAKLTPGSREARLDQLSFSTGPKINTSLEAVAATDFGTDRFKHPLEPEITTTLDEFGNLSASLPLAKPSVSRLPHITVERAGGALGARVRGVDLANVTPEEVEEINRLFLENLVLVFPDQHITPEEQMDFVRNWGDVAPHPLGSRKDIHPDGIPEEILVVQNTMKAGTGQARNDYWHSDMAFMETPAAVSVLYAKKVPTGYGNTAFANCYTGYEMLSDGLKEQLRGMKAVFSSRWARPDAGEKRAETFAFEADDVSHPVVRTHRETGRKSLYIGEQQCQRFEGWSMEESAPLLKFLVSKVTRAENVYRHNWTEKDVVMWDNRCALHYAIFDYGPEHDREMHRACATDVKPQ